ncbi:fibulin-7 isoform 4-T4 [Hipposideros larvatus]
MRPRGASALFLLLPLLVASPAQLGAQNHPCHPRPSMGSAGGMMSVATCLSGSGLLRKHCRWCPAEPSAHPLTSLVTEMNCVNKQQLLTSIRQLQQLLKAQETRFAEGVRSMRSRLAALQGSVSKVGPDASPVSCPALKAPLDGRKFGSKYLVDHEVHFTCNPGFRLVGPSSVVCLHNGTWTGAEPHCTDISECSSQLCQNGGTCVEGVNQYKCICPPGRTGSRCQQQAQTAAPERVVGDPAFSRAPRCAQVERTRQCSCEAGFQLSGVAGNSVCQDVNECELYGQEARPRLCMHACVNTPGSYRCACPSGYRTLQDGKSCEDVDECVSPQHLCPRGTTCVNTGGSFQCVSPACPEASSNISYVKTSPLRGHLGLFLSRLDLLGYVTKKENTGNWDCSPVRIWPGPWDIGTVLLLRTRW